MTDDINQYRQLWYWKKRSRLHRRIQKLIKELWGKLECTMAEEVSTIIIIDEEKLHAKVVAIRKSYGLATL